MTSVQHRIVAGAVGVTDKDLLIDTVAQASSAGVRPYIAGLVEGLRQRGHNIGADYVIDYREHAPDGIQKAVTDGIKQSKEAKENPLIFPMSTTVLKAAMSVSNSIPIVFPSISHPQQDGVVPGGNATGVSAQRSQTVGECLARFKQTVTSLTTVHVLTRRRYDPAERAQPYLTSSNKSLGLTLVTAEVDSEKDIMDAINGIAPQPSPNGPPIGVLVSPNDLLFAAADKIISTAHTRLPTFFSTTDWVKPNLPSALAGYGVPQYKCGELAAAHVHHVLWNGKNPGDITTVDAKHFEWAVSRSAAAALNIDISQVPNQATII